MGTNNNSITHTNDFQPVIDLVRDSVKSVHTKRAYERAITEFLAWWEEQGKPPMVKAIVNRYRVELEQAHKSPSSINQAMSAIRKMAAEAADNGLLEQPIANGIANVEGIHTAGVRTGNWYNKRQAEAIVNAPDLSTDKGARDRAILALMIGAGLRISEVAGLTLDHIQQREGRWVIVDLVGKRNRVRSIPIPSWSKVAIDRWVELAGIQDGRMFRGCDKWGNIDPDSASITPQVVYNLVAEYLKQLGLKGSAHDLRRTFAKLARKGGAELTQIQLTLGHSNVAITQKYIGEDQNLTDAPCDRLGLDLSGD